MTSSIRTLLCAFVAATVAGCGTETDVARSTPEESLVALWTFDEGQGTQAADTSGNSNTATIRNGDWGPGKYGQALQMNGGNDGIVEIPLSDSLRSTGDRISVMAWTYRTARHNVAIVGHGYPYLFLGFHGPQFKWQVVSAKGKRAGCYADREHKAELDQWFHVAGTYDGRTVRLYRDGEEICSESLSGSIEMPEVPFTVSGYVDKKGEIVDEITGMLDDVRIYSEALTPEEIQKIMGAGQ